MMQKWERAALAILGVLWVLLSVPLGCIDCTADAIGLLDGAPADAGQR